MSEGSLQARCWPPAKECARWCRTPAKGGVERVGDVRLSWRVEDADPLERAFGGADAVFVLLPRNLHLQPTGGLIASVTEVARVQKPREIFKAKIKVREPTNQEMET